MKAKVYANIRVDTRDTKPVRDRDAGCSKLNTSLNTEKAVSMRRLALLTNLLNSVGQGVELSLRGSHIVALPARACGAYWLTNLDC